LGLVRTGAGDPSVGDDGRVRGVLEDELARLSGADAFTALGLAAGAPPHEVRASFLALVKRYHPTRYARRPRDVVRLANEVFFRLKAAYEAASEQSSEPAPAGRRRMNRRSERLEQISPPSRPKLDVDTALARRRRLRSYPVLPATGTPQTVETITPEEMAERVRRLEEERSARCEAAAGELRAGRLEKAREAFRALLAELPGDKRVRAYLHYTLGREHQAAGRDELARGEYERALALEPRFEPAQKSMAVLAGGADDNGREEERGGGLLSRWFRR